MRVSNLWSTVIKVNLWYFFTDHLRLLLDFKDKSTSVFLFYTHGTYGDWGNALLQTDNFPQEARNVKEFVKEYTVKGLILKGIEAPYICVSAIYSQYLYIACHRVSNSIST